MAHEQVLQLDAAWETILSEENKHLLEGVLPEYMKARRWFGGKGGTIGAVEVQEAIQLVAAPNPAYLVLLGVSYLEGNHQTYALPLTFASGEQAADLQAQQPGAVIVSVSAQGTPGVLYDASFDKEFDAGMLVAIREGKHFPSASGEVAASPTEAFSLLVPGSGGSLEAKVMGAEQSNTSIRYGDRFVLKLYRRLEEGTNPDLEIGRFLLGTGFPNVPTLAGSIEYVIPTQEPVTLGILQEFIPNNGDAWQYTLIALDDYMAKALDSGMDPARFTPSQRHPLDLLDTPVPSEMADLLGPYLDAARLLGRRTAEMHLALASRADNADFAPEPLSHAYRQALYNSVQSLAKQALDLLRRHESELPADAKPEAAALLADPERITSGFRRLLNRDIGAAITRCHGDYHLGQVLYTGEDFIIIDFEGEPVRSLADRRRKHSPLKDVAGMLRSFHYAANSAVFKWRSQRYSNENIMEWADAWHRWIAAAYLGSYLDVAMGGDVFPSTPDDLRMLLDVFILEKAIYELVYELNNRPDWIGIPLSGIAQLVLPDTDEAQSI